MIWKSDSWRLPAILLMSRSMKTIFPLFGFYCVFSNGTWCSDAEMADDIDDEDAKG